MTKNGLHTIRHRPQFLQMCCRNWKYDEKSSLILSKNCLLRRMHFAKKFFAKCSQIWQITLYTLFAFYMDFVHLFLFRHCLRIVCSWLQMAVSIIFTDLITSSSYHHHLPSVLVRITLLPCFSHSLFSSFIIYSRMCSF